MTQKDPANQHGIVAGDVFAHFVGDRTRFFRGFCAPMTPIVGFRFVMIIPDYFYQHSLLPFAVELAVKIFPTAPVEFPVRHRHHDSRPMTGASGAHRHCPRIRCAGICSPARAAPVFRASRRSP